MLRGNPLVNVYLTNGKPPELVNETASGGW